MIIVIDENLPPSWSSFLADLGFDARHWKDVGCIGDADTIIFDYASERGAVIITQDLDYTRLLALRGTNLPSLIQLRVDCPLPSVIGNDIRLLLETYHEHINKGALFTLDGRGHRMRMLPLRKD